MTWVKLRPTYLKLRMEQEGSFWFEPDTVKFFGTKLSQSVYYNDRFDAYAWVQSDLQPVYNSKRMTERRVYWACWWTPSIGKSADRLHTDAYWTRAEANARLQQFLNGEIATHTYFLEEPA